TATALPSPGQDGRDARANPKVSTLGAILALCRPADTMPFVPRARRGPFRDLPPEVAILTAVSFTVALGFGIVAPAIPAFAHDRRHHRQRRRDPGRVLPDGRRRRRGRRARGRGF